MRRAAAAALVSASLLGLGSASAAVEPPHARVLLYHRVGDPRHPSTNVSAAAFRDQMGWLRDHGFRVVTTEALERFLLLGEPLPERAVAIHFDDGYRSVFENALPVLREFGYPFTIFLPTEAVERGFPDFVTWDMARTMVEAGASVGAHGHRHLRLGGGATAEATARPGEGVREEFLEGARRLRRRGFATRWLAYPYGEYDDEMLRQARETGFSLAFSQDPGAIGRSHDPYRLPRFAVVGSSAEMTTFVERMGYLPLLLENETPPPGVLDEGTPRLLGATVRDPQDFDPGTVSVFLSEQGRLEAWFDPRTGRVTAQTKGTLHGRLNRVLISLRHRDTEKFGLGAWLLIHPGGSS